MDGTGVPVVKKETVGRQGKIAGQAAHTREVKLGCVFTQMTWDKKGYPIRASASTTYTGAVETAEEFGRRLDREAQRRGWGRAQKQVVMGDGAEWIWNLAALHFPDAIHIVDLYHARQHLWELARRLYPNDAGKQRAWIQAHQKRLLDKGKNSWAHFALSDRITPKSQRKSAPRPTTSRGMPSACAIPGSAANTSLWVRASSKPVAKPWSLPASNARECSGPSGEPMPSWPSDPHFSMAALRITGKAAARLSLPNSNFYVAHSLPLGAGLVLWQNSIRCIRCKDAAQIPQSRPVDLCLGLWPMMSSGWSSLCADKCPHSRF